MTTERDYFTSPRLFRKRPVVIEARQLPLDYNLERAQLVDVLSWSGAKITERGVIVPTLEGEHLASPGDWIIRGIAGEFYPCKPKIFAETYEVAE